MDVLETLDNLQNAAEQDSEKNKSKEKVIIQNIISTNLKCILVKIIP